MQSDRNVSFGCEENQYREPAPLVKEFIPSSQNNQSSHENTMTTETSQSSLEGQKCAQEPSEKQPIVYEDKAQSSRNVDSSSFDASGKNGLTEPSELKLKYSAKAGPNIKEAVVITKGSENGTDDADNIHLNESIKEATNIKTTTDCAEDLRKKTSPQEKNKQDSQTKAYIAKIGENNESIKGLIKKVSENQFQPDMEMANPTETNEKDFLAAVSNCYSEPKAPEEVKTNDFYLAKKINAIIEDSLNKDFLGYAKGEKDQNSARPQTPYPNSLQSVPTDNLNRQIIEINENSTKSVPLARIEEENDHSNSTLPRNQTPYPEVLQPVPTLHLDNKNIAVGENSTARKYMASGVELVKKKSDSALPRLRSPYPDFLHTGPEVSSSTAKRLFPAAEIAIPKTNEASEDNKTNPVEEEPLNLSLHSYLDILNDDSTDSSVSGIRNTATKSLIRVPEIPLYATNGTVKRDETNSNEEKPSNSTLRLIPYTPPDSSTSETSDTEPGVELKITIVPEDLEAAPTIPIPANNEKSSKRMSEILSSIPNPFKRKSKSYSPQSKSEISKVETDEEIKNMTELQAQKPTNQSIYKLAYNESVTDSSSTHSRSLSPVDREKLIPRNTFHDEIVVYEADSDSEPGSEDLELLPHRYDCDTFQNRENNLYINKLSLAVELIRTQEELPYDDQFKRIVEDDTDPNRETSGEESGFDAEYRRWDAGNDASNSLRNVVVTSPPRRSDNLATTGVTTTAVDTFTDSCEEAGVAEFQMPIDAQNADQESRAINRRLRGHLRHYLSSRAFGNPCLCCILM